MIYSERKLYNVKALSLIENLMKKFVTNIIIIKRIY